MFIHLKVTPNAKKDVIRPTERPDYFEVLVRDAAEEHMANKKVLALAKDFFAMKFGATRVRLVKGHQSPKKIIEIEVL